MELRCSGLRDLTTCDLVEPEEPSTCLWSNRGTENTVPVECQWKFECRIRSCWSTSFSMRCITGRRRPRKRDICSGRTKRPNSSSLQNWIGSKLVCKSVVKDTTCWIFWFTERISITCIWITISIWNLWKLWPQKRERSRVSGTLSIYVEKFFVWRNWLLMPMFSTVWVTSTRISLPMECNIYSAMWGSSREFIATNTNWWNRSECVKTWNMSYTIDSTLELLAKVPAVDFGRQLGECGCFSCEVWFRCSNDGWGIF